MKDFTWLALKMEGMDWEPGNVAASRSWEWASGYRKQDDEALLGRWCGWVQRGWGCGQAWAALAGSRSCKELTEGLAPLQLHGHRFNLKKKKRKEKTMRRKSSIPKNQILQITQKSEKHSPQYLRKKCSL